MVNYLIQDINLEKKSTFLLMINQHKITAEIQLWNSYFELI